MEVMSLQDTPSGIRCHISFFGLRNVGKSSLVNAITNQPLSVVSEVSGTTTDPVSKTMELLPIGPVVITDTPGIDDVGPLGRLRVEKTREVLRKTDVAILVVDILKGFSQPDQDLIALFQERELPYLIVYNKCDQLDVLPVEEDDTLYVSALRHQNIEALKDKIGKLSKPIEKVVVGDLVDPGDTIVLVVPVDSAAPKGRLILPQQLVIRDVLDHGGLALTCQDDQLEHLLEQLKGPPKLVITDSQKFGKVSRIVPDDIQLTSFSILMARYKGFLTAAVQGVQVLNTLEDGDTILISEGCTHHRQCGDIGRDKIPAWIAEYTHAACNYRWSSGNGFPDDIDAKLIIHCGGCMLNEKEMRYRIKHAQDIRIPVTNYGIVIAHMHGILKRSLEPFPQLYEQLNQ